MPIKARRKNDNRKHTEKLPTNSGCHNARIQAVGRAENTEFDLLRGLQMKDKEVRCYNAQCQYWEATNDCIKEYIIIGRKGQCRFFEEEK